MIIHLIDVNTTVLALDQSNEYGESISPTVGECCYCEMDIRLTKSQFLLETTELFRSEAARITNGEKARLYLLPKSIADRKTGKTAFPCTMEMQYNHWVDLRTHYVQCQDEIRGWLIADCPMTVVRELQAATHLPSRPVRARSGDRRITQI